MGDTQAVKTETLKFIQFYCISGDIEYNISSVVWVNGVHPR